MRHSAYKGLHISFQVLVLVLFSASWIFGQTPTGLPYASSETSPQLGYGMNNTSGQSPFLGSVPSGKPTGTVIHLSIKDAIRLGLKYNLGLVESDLNTRSARAERLKELSHLMPNINAALSQSVQQINLKAMGINFPGVPATVGPFGVQDARGYLSRPYWIGMRSRNCGLPRSGCRPPNSHTRIAGTSWCWRWETPI